MLRFRVLLAILIASTALSARAREESVNFAPPIVLSGIEAQLRDLVGSAGSQLCAPIALAHGFQILKNLRARLNPGPAAIPDLDGDGFPDTAKDRIRHFFTDCETDKRSGTRYHAVVACMQRYLNHSATARMVGPHAADAARDARGLRSPLRLSDIREPLRKKALVLMGIGWYRRNPATGVYEREGGHFVNLYGYDYDRNSGDEMMTLIVVNSWVDYRNRAPERAYDRVQIRRIERGQRDFVPREIAYELTGEGFQFADIKAFAEDIFVALPDTEALTP